MTWAAYSPTTAVGEAFFPTKSSRANGGLMIAAGRSRAGAREATTLSAATRRLRVCSQRGGVYWREVRAARQGDVAARHVVSADDRGGA